MSELSREQHPTVPCAEQIIAALRARCEAAELGCETYKNCLTEEMAENVKLFDLLGVMPQIKEGTAGTEAVTQAIQDLKSQLATETRYANETEAQLCLMRDRRDFFKQRLAAANDEARRMREAIEDLTTGRRGSELHDVGSIMRHLRQALTPPAQAGRRRLNMSNIHSDYIDADGTVIDPPNGIETYYRPLLATAMAGEGDDRYLRVFIDDDPCNLETRIPFHHLIKYGWTPPTKVSL